LLAAIGGLLLPASTYRVNIQSEVWISLPGTPLSATGNFTQTLPISRSQQSRLWQKTVMMFY
jgi:hypothetical protein